MPAALDGRVVLVTGAARGIGRGVAEAAAEAGATVVLGDVDPAVEETARRIEGPGRPALGLRLDVTERASIESAIARTLEAFARLDGWVNNAGLLRLDPALDAKPEDFEAQMRVNVQALFACC